MLNCTNYLYLKSQSNLKITSFMKVCGCKPWNVPQVDGDKTCFYLGNMCFHNVITKYQKTELEGKSFL